MSVVSLLAQDSEKNKKGMRPCFVLCVPNAQDTAFDSNDGFFRRTGDFFEGRKHTRPSAGAGIFQKFLKRFSETD